MANGWTAKQIKPPYIIHYGISATSGDATIRQLKEAGVNIVQMNNYFDVSDTVRTNVSQIAQKYQMGLLPWGMHDPSQREAFVRKWSLDPAVFGWYNFDEPSREGEWGYGVPGYLHLMQKLHAEMKEWSGGLPMVSIWDDPVWGANLGDRVTDIMAYEVAYPFGNFANPYAFTTNRTKIYGYGGGPLYNAKRAGMTVIPVLQAWEIRGHSLPGMPDLPGQYDAYQAGFPAGKFAGGAYLYDPSGHVIGVPEIKASVQQLVRKLGGAVWTPPAPEPTPERKYRAEPGKKVWKQYTCPNGDVVEITNYDYVGCYEPEIGHIICPSIAAPTMQKCPVEGLPVAEGYDIRLIQEARPAEPEPEPYEPPVTEPEIVGAPVWHEIICPRCTSVLKYKTQAIDPKYFKYLNCSVCEKELGIEGLEIQTVIAKPWPLPAEPIKEPTIVPITDAEKRTLEILESLGWKPPGVPTPTPALPEPTFAEVIVSADWWKENWPWVGVSVLGLSTIVILAKGGK